MSEKNVRIERARRGHTALRHCRPLRRQLDEDNVPEAGLRVVRDGHRPKVRRVIENDKLMVCRVLLRW